MSEITATLHGPADILKLGDYTLIRGEPGIVEENLLAAYTASPNASVVTWGSQEVQPAVPAPAVEEVQEAAMDQETEPETSKRSTRKATKEG